MGAGAKPAIWGGDLAGKRDQPLSDLHAAAEMLNKISAAQAVVVKGVQEQLVAARIAQQQVDSSWAAADAAASAAQEAHAALAAAAAGDEVTAEGASAAAGEGILSQQCRELLLQRTTACLANITVTTMAERLDNCCRMINMLRDVALAVSSGPSDVVFSTAAAAAAEAMRANAEAQQKVSASKVAVQAANNSLQSGRDALRNRQPQAYHFLATQVQLADVYHACQVEGRGGMDEHSDGSGAESSQRTGGEGAVVGDNDGTGVTKIFVDLGAHT